MNVQTEIIPSTEKSSKPIEYGSNLIVKELDDKIIICAKNTTKLKQGVFELEADQIKIESGVGIKITSKGKDTLVISVDLTKIEEAMFDLKNSTNDRLKVIEAVFSKILKQAKN